LGLYIGLAQNGSTHLNWSSIFILIKLNWGSPLKCSLLFYFFLKMNRASWADPMG
jgi:hypothetical protein